MSALFAFFTDTEYYFATDTLTYSGLSTNARIEKLSQKIDFYPEYRTCIVSLGYSRLKRDIYAFIRSHTIGTDISELAEALKNYFLSFINLDNYPVLEGHNNVIGDAHIFGYSQALNRLVKYYLLVDRDNVSVEVLNPVSGSFYCHPPISDSAKNAILKKANNNEITNISDLCTEFMKTMYHETMNDSKRLVSMGGEMVLAVLATEPQFSCRFSIPHRFDNYDEAVAVIASKQKAETTISNG
ncbi:hypothetical protein J3L18_10815 [Mucilaginibacter gossypii]|uniref:hypothetical protein n=1 Tax=Mucilaginibacter gossypii TaxID=551996 RepID=UPI000DCDD47E|nr:MULTISPECIES: hypothetical protein [Mucilaginibacter]QTE39518.1 hypothetical protein J3L18_10815 [Mucilaginibacter gossypii]RAV56120.1 hypothetical protein DIU36_15305 [Mucilaginibacter rubeus]